ncbi:hypothetical protein, partial [Bacillus sp. B4EP4a]|uniref:hypothetical protein n=1 Tax=Bacillus sp. B4EP4a TaxID=2590665 RepID=UPI001C67EDFA
VCAHLKFNVGALFCSVFKEQSRCRLLRKRLLHLTMFSTSLSTCFLIFLSYFRFDEAAKADVPQRHVLI